MKLKAFNDFYAVICTLLIFTLWIGSCWWQIPEIVLGASISGMTLIWQFYFRKKPNEADKWRVNHDYTQQTTESSL